MEGERVGFNSSRWRNSSENFPNEEDDEEALKWAALERLPTYLRLRRGIFSDQEIDINKLDFVHKKNLLDKLINVAQEDNEKFLLKLKDRLDRVGLEMPRIEVRFEHLGIEAEAYVAGREFPSVFNFSLNMLEGFLNYLNILPSRKKPLSILRAISGIIKPQRMTLLLGPPSSGKTTLLLALAGKLDKSLKVSGKVTYNGQEMQEFVPQRSSAYVSQYDLHIGEMTVRETLAFSARCQGVGPRYEILAELCRREKAANIKPDPDMDILMKILGLEMCADILVGDELTRGISGGQRKRVTTGEMLVGPARALFMDEISTGLDSSTTFQIVESLKQSIHVLQGTALISLLQPAPETYELFDDIILLSDGYIVYQGPRENVLDFFESNGFKCPERKGVADFLQEVTSRKDQEQYWMHKEQPYIFVSAKEFVESFQVFHVGRKLGDELAIPFDKSKTDPSALTTDKYGVSKKQLFKACFAREFLLMKRNSFVYIFKMIQFVLLALITMTLFLRTEMHRNTITDGGVYLGALFFAIFVVMFNGFAEIAMAIMKLPVYYKQRDLLFFPAWAYALPTWILKIPISLIEVAVWVIMTYYVIGFDPNIKRFLKQYLILLCTSQMSSGLFRLVAVVGRNIIVANTFGSFSLLIVVVMGGFVMSRDDVTPWWIWGYWTSPMMYVQNAISVNEFLGNSWRQAVPNSTEQLGITFLKYRGMFPEARWYWIGVAALIGYIFLFNFLYTLALKYLDPFGKQQAVLPKEDSNEKQTINSERRDEIRGAFNEKKKQAMVLPFEPFSITFSEIKYAVDMPQEMKAQGIPEDRLELLKGVSGAFRPGVLTALMGLSGAGKTTLMDVLAGRKTGGYIDGNILISGYPKRQETFARIAGYCEQNDIHSPHVTVYESLLYSAWLRLAPEVDSDTRKVLVEQVMELVELDSLGEAIVGLPGVSGLSIEQRKRLTIAVELVANPSVIFMDEPTSGLDARAAAIVMRTVRNTVDTGRTVVCTIHQPSIDIFDAFDELLLLKRGGEEIYVGPIGLHACHLIKYFEEIEGVPKIRDGYNPATWMLEITSMAQEEALGLNFSNIYKNSELFRRNQSLIEELSSPLPGSKDLCFRSRYSQSFVTQCRACLWKQHWSYWRNPSYTAVRLLFTAFIALMFGTMFWNLGTKRRRMQDLFNAMGSMYAAVIFLGVQNASSIQPVAAVERTVFYRERAAGMYSALPYAIAQVMIELPYILFQALIYGVIVYAMIGFEWSVSKFFWYLFFMYFTLLYFTLFGMMTVAVTPNHHIAAVVAIAFYALWNLFSGFIVPQTRIPVWWRWCYWICPVAWTLYGLVVTQFGDIEESLEMGTAVQDFVLSYFGFRHDFLGIVVAAHLGFCLLFGFIFAFSIKVFNFQKR
ncbi:pleiotropic drug resistance protein 1-like isoform X2 [Euphorbia lathyris]|uniref:pleiotropic drug resistance protein 1-like isoform X2 n=1 Tax=Euphorbia lathyris TaxID=212925 RepID=UPI003313DE3D